MHDGRLYRDSFGISKLWCAPIIPPILDAMALTHVGIETDTDTPRIGPAINNAYETSDALCFLIGQSPVWTGAHDHFALCALRGLIKPRDLVVAVYQSCFDWLALCPRDLNYVSTGAMGRPHRMRWG